MALSPGLCDREQAKFIEGTGGETLVQVTGTATDPVPVTGSFVVASPGPFKVTGASVTDSSTAFPSTNQLDRAAFSIRNLDPVESIFIVNSAGISKVTAGIDVWEIGPNESLNTDLDDTNKIILVAESGKTVNIALLEIKGP